mmetsp:Transcript_15264/g.21629  ORF Transcript_15264/g.21629 Transcript_15264/m.21629 type:complete len:80 (-) Transcript_15264:263-502(-)
MRWVTLSLMTSRISWTIPTTRSPSSFRGRRRSVASPSSRYAERCRNDNHAKRENSHDGRGGQLHVSRRDLSPFRNEEAN